MGATLPAHTGSCCFEEKLSAELFADAPSAEAAIAADLINVERYSASQVPECCCDERRHRSEHVYRSRGAPLADEQDLAAVLPGAAHWPASLTPEPRSARLHWSFEAVAPGEASEGSLSDDGVRVMAAALPERRRRAKRRQPPEAKTWLTLEDVAWVKANRARRQKARRDDHELEERLRLQAAQACYACKDELEEQVASVVFATSVGSHTESDADSRDFFGADADMQDEKEERADAICKAAKMQVLMKASPEIKKLSEAKLASKGAAISIASLRARPDSAPSRRHAYMANRYQHVPTKISSRFMIPTHD